MLGSGCGPSPVGPVGQREEAAGRHGGEPVQCEVRRGEALVNKLVAVVVGRRRGDMDHKEQDNQGCQLSRHNSVRLDKPLAGSMLASP